jgi:hypothetical protein
MIDRRRFLLSVSANIMFVCAPALIPAARLMPVRRVPVVASPRHFGFVERLYIHLNSGAIAALQADGKSAEEIAVELNRRGLSGMNAAPWTAREVIGVVHRAQDILHGVETRRG